MGDGESVNFTLSQLNSKNCEVESGLAGTSPATDTLAPGRRTLGCHSNHSNFAIFHVQMTSSLSSRSIPWKTFPLRTNTNHARRFTPARSPGVSTAWRGPLDFPGSQKAVPGVHWTAAGCLSSCVLCPERQCRAIAPGSRRPCMCPRPPGFIQRLLQNTGFQCLASDLGEFTTSPSPLWGF